MANLIQRVQAAGEPLAFNPHWVLSVAGLLLLLATFVGYATSRSPSGKRAGTIGSLLLTASSCLLLLLAMARYLSTCSGDKLDKVTWTPWELQPVPDGPRLALVVVIDPLSALFLALVGLIGLTVAIYSLGWLSHDPLSSWVAGSFAAFTASLILVLIADIGLWTILSLEIVTLLSLDLARYGGLHKNHMSETVRAARAYLVFSHASLLCLLAGLLPALYLGRPPTGLTHTLGLALVMIALNMRMGLFPFHVWIPLVHPQLPTNTHAMVSAVMLKLPIFLMLRIIFDTRFGPVETQWGALLLLTASLTAVVTVAHAVVAKDLKTALAYHSVENMAIISVGIGVSILFGLPSATPPPHLIAAGELALIAALFHAVNHAIFKTLLFLGTASIERTTGDVGFRGPRGLLRAYPAIGVPFLIGAVAISGLPPLNGFISEWLTFQSIFSGGHIYAARSYTALTAFLALSTAVFMLSTALVLTTIAFTKMVSDRLLGPTPSTTTPSKLPLSVKIVPAGLAALCVIIGLQPWLLIRFFRLVTGSLIGNHLATRATPPDPIAIGPVSADPSGLAVSVGSHGAYLPTLPLLILWLTPLVLFLLVRPNRWERRPVWVGGTPYRSASMRLTGGAFSSHVWGLVARIDEESENFDETTKSEHPPLPDKIRVAQRRVVVDRVGHTLNLLLTFVDRSAESLATTLQNGDVRRYLMYMGGAVCAALLLAILYPGLR